MFVHGDNIVQKENHMTKYTDSDSKIYLKQIRTQYEIWKKSNLDLKGPFVKTNEDDLKIIEQRVKLLTEYKDFLDKQIYAEHFDSRSNLHSTVLEEFMYYLFKDMVQELSKHSLIGKAHTFKDIFFQAKNYKEMVVEPCVNIEKKDHDFIIGVSINAKLSCDGSATSHTEIIQVPAVAIECKTYLDKTMLEGASNAASELLVRNPNSIYIVVAEWLKLTESVNLKKYKIEQIYVLRKQKNTDREFRYSEDYKKNPIYSDVVFTLFSQVRNHLTLDWGSSIGDGLERGYLI